MVPPFVVFAFIQRKRFCRHKDKERARAKKKTAPHISMCGAVKYVQDLE